MDDDWKKLASDTWPSRASFERGDFFVRDNLGDGGSRANSAQAMRLDPQIQTRISRYIIWPEDTALEDELKKHGYQENDHAIVLQLKPERCTTHALCNYFTHISEDLSDFFNNNSVDKARVDIMQRCDLDKFFVTYEDNGEIMGAVYVSYFGERAWLYSLVVAQQFRQRGIARHIMNAVIDKIACMGVHTVALSVLPSNLGAINLYASLGFEQISQYYFLERTEPLCV